jgi:deoxyribodipyrimidine photo-lyase
MIRAAAERVPVRVEVVDGLGLLPLRAAPRTFTAAHSLRRFLQKTLPSHLPHAPRADPFAGIDLPRAPMPRAIADLAPLDARELADPSALIARLPIDHAIGRVPDRGGGTAASARLGAFLRDGLARYGDRSHPDLDAASGLSPWLHWGHLSVHDVMHGLASHTGWTIEKLAEKPTGTREGWWNASPEADAFLDELVTWRELGHVRAIHDPEGVLSYDGIPDWAQRTLAKHDADPRPALYDRDALARAETDDPVWNAAQRQLLAEGRIQNYLRMLWGKRVLAWTRTPREAWDVLVDLNDRYAIDGRDPNGWANIGWIFGSYDRPWGPERPIYGTVRYMTSDATRKKLKMKEWLRRWGPT